MSRPCLAQVIVDGKLDGEENMRFDRAMFERAATDRISAARIYQWDGPWISLGRSQTSETAIVDPKVNRWVIRPTGGGGVLHGHDITVSMARPIRGDSRKLRDVYRALIAPLVLSLRSIGVDAVLGESIAIGHPRPSADCFVNASENDVVDRSTGRKLVGVAMRVTRTAVLAQCSIPVGVPLVDPARVFACPHVPQPLQISIGELTGVLEEELSRAFPQ